MPCDTDVHKPEPKFPIMGWMQFKKVHSEAGSGSCSLYQPRLLQMLSCHSPEGKSDGSSLVMKTSTIHLQCKWTIYLVQVNINAGMYFLTKRGFQQGDLQDAIEVRKPELFLIHYGSPPSIILRKWFQEQIFQWWFMGVNLEFLSDLTN